MAKKKVKKATKKTAKTGAIAMPEIANKSIDIKAGDYTSRVELENHVRSKYGLTTEPKKVQITGTEQELKRLSLGDGSLFWGITCICVEPVEPRKVAPAEKINRGKRTSFGIENREEPRKAPDA